ncbi:hypothetical protein KAFR_0A02770 [Kazachstania africana CBS 2517]|uniref:Protein Zds1 C-terminal domain-containing protein n=1 Tax=Kazachstania africana (strain ATCC 22294 / BCRC 22015 / CBS 2517 / CECT 1963 / NBRC 1671 / NRRL Y-8276) TaxID=1071382 RepID=H2AMW3_KAZAF|nr:hypothetical protein KAFR_0A02770 [Kazachstania africana CBS 2517]CCF55713.1 hypothetical protein KAFR_0A02770 [Kazachstania africana CBS 2517]
MTQDGTIHNSIQIRKRSKTDDTNNVESLRNKRKSEVLIAARSIDNEVRNVKNLKRLSIGSMDLLIDPELEYKVSHVNTNDDLNKRKSWTPDSTTFTGTKVNTRPKSKSFGTHIHDPPLVRINNNSDSSSSDEEEDDSIDITRTEYLHDQTTLQSQRKLPKHRNLSGINSSRQSSRKLSNDRTDNEDKLKNNLLWVPASKHPNVKPQNYIELVQDTLQHIHIDDSKSNDNDNINKENDAHSSKNGSLVRRPSRLRKSYTEYEEENYQDDYNRNNSNDEENPNIGNFRSSNKGRSVSLKDITEELTKISNKAGLTDSDAITLARTLSMTGSFSNGTDDMELLSNYSDQQDNNFNNDEHYNKNDDEFASNMLMKNGLTIPQRSSLRRSKFNTYRVRSSSAPSNIHSKPINSNIKEPKTFKYPYNSKTSIKKSPVNRSNNYTEPVTESPGSISDLYDHYAYSSVDEETSNATNLQETSNDGSIDSNESSNDSVLVKPSHSESMIHENFDALASDTVTDGWSNVNNENAHFLQRNNNNGRLNDELVSKGNQESTHYNKTRSNHSKNRHKPLFTSTNTPMTAKTKNVSKKKQTLEEKIVKLFKRKAHRRTSSSSENQIFGQEPLKEDVLFEYTTERENSAGDNLEGHSIHSHESFKSSDSETSDKELPSLQPAVSVVSTKKESNASAPPSSASSSSLSSSSSTVIQTVELEGDESQDVSYEALKGEDFRNPELSSSETTAEQEKELKSAISSLPPRKLTFDDVKRPEKPNAPIHFSDSAFGFPLPMLTTSTVIMFDHRLGINVERAIYRLSHLKLSDPKRELRQQVLLSNFMYAYLNLVNHTLYMEQAAVSSNESDYEEDLEEVEQETGGVGRYTTAHNASDGTIVIPDM